MTILPCNRVLHPLLSPLLQIAIVDQMNQIIVTGREKCHQKQSVLKILINANTRMGDVDGYGYLIVMVRVNL